MPATPVPGQGEGVHVNRWKRRVVAIDLDEVLGLFVSQLVLFHNTTFGTSLTVEDFTSYEFHEVWGGGKEEANKKVEEFFESEFFLGEGGTGGIPVIEGALDVLRKHAMRLELHVVTSRQHTLEEVTRAWISKHFPEIFVDVHLGNHYGESGEKISKPDLCKKIQAEMLIDDSLRYTRQCSTAGIKACLFGNYPWNSTDEPLPTTLVRASDWDEVDKILWTVPGGAAPEATISILATKHPAFYVDEAKAALLQYSTISLRALEKAIVVAVDSAQKLERLGLVRKTSVQTSLASVETGDRACIEICMERAPDFLTLVEQGGMATEGSGAEESGEKMLGCNTREGKEEEGGGNPSAGEGGEEH